MGEKLQPIDIPTEDECLSRLTRHVMQEKAGLKDPFFKGRADSFFKDRLEEFSKNARKMVTSLINVEGCRKAEIALDLSVLTLYDLSIFIDDSPSMGKPEHKRILTNTMKEICKIYSLANNDGIKAVRFLNHRQGKKNVKLDGVSDVMGRCAHTGLSRIGTELHRKVLDSLVLRADMSKPLLIIIVTDGTVEGESGTLLPKVIVNCIASLKKQTRSHQSVAFQFCRIGDDPEAIRFLKELDDHEKLGDHIDCMSERFSLRNIPDSDDFGVPIPVPDDAPPGSPSSDTSDPDLDAGPPSSPKPNAPDPTKWSDERWNVMCKLFLGPLMEHWDNYDDPMDENDLAGGDDLDDALDKRGYYYEDDD